MSQQTTSIATKIQEDVSWCATPDLPALRYAGPQLVFLWDEMKFNDTLNWNQLSEGENFIISSYDAMTDQSYLPFTQAGYHPYKGPTRFCFRNTNWVNSWQEDEVKHFNVDPLPLSGRVLSVGLEGMIAFDDYYGNDGLCRRSLIDVIDDDGKFAKAWFYFGLHSVVGKFDPHAMKYKLRNGKAIVNLPQSQGLWTIPSTKDLH